MFDLIKDMKILQQWSDYIICMLFEKQFFINVHAQLVYGVYSFDNRVFEYHFIKASFNSLLSYISFEIFPRLLCFCCIKLVENCPIKILPNF